MEELFEELLPAMLIGITALFGSYLKAAKKASKNSQSQPPYTPEQPAASSAAAPYQAAQPSFVSFAEQPGLGIAPTVHPHLQPDCAPHDAPGSLGVTSTEGKDPCHEAQLTHPRTADEASQEAPGLALDWTGENLVKAFVMQEVLTRPAVRRQAR